MERKLKLLFDFQKFSQNARLQKLVEPKDEDSDTSGKMLTLDNLGSVSAAGDISGGKKNTEDEENNNI